MTQPPIRFNDGESYERGMGAWSVLAGHVFLDWLAPRSGLRWIDIGCGTGAFTELLVQRCAPAETQGIDPSEAQLMFARTRPGARNVLFLQGDAMALPFDDNRFDAAAMALVIFFVPEPAKGVAEMARVVGPGGTVAAYAWDIEGGGAPLDALWVEMRALGVTPPLPPNAGASGMAALHGLWTDAGLEDIDTNAIVVQRRFTDFEDFWRTTTIAGGGGAVISAMTPDEVERLRSRVQARIPGDASGQVVYEARANAVKGRVPR